MRRTRHWRARALGCVYYRAASSCRRSAPHYADDKGGWERNEREDSGLLTYSMPTPTVLAALLRLAEEPDFITVAHIEHNDSRSHVLRHRKNSAVPTPGLRRIRHSAYALLPSENIVVETDYCGIMTGKKTDKAVIFDVFYGELKTAL